jgi:hypothetical protein
MGANGCEGENQSTVSIRVNSCPFAVHFSESLRSFVLAYRTRSPIVLVLELVLIVLASSFGLPQPLVGSRLSEISLSNSRIPGLYLAVVGGKANCQKVRKIIEQSRMSDQFST